MGLGYLGNGNCLSHEDSEIGLVRHLAEMRQRELDGLLIGYKMLARRMVKLLRDS